MLIITRRRQSSEPGELKAKPPSSGGDPRLSAVTRPRLSIGQVLTERHHSTARQLARGTFIMRKGQRLDIATAKTRSGAVGGVGERGQSENVDEIGLIAACRPADGEPNTVHDPVQPFER